MIDASPIQPPQTLATDTQLKWCGLSGSSASLAISNFASASSNPLLLITPDIHTASQIRQELRFFCAHNQLPLLKFPDWETLPYDHFSPGKSSQV